MESLEHATKRGANIIAEYLGGSITCDAHHMTDPRKDGLGVSSCITKCLEDSGISPEEVKPYTPNPFNLGFHNINLVGIHILVGELYQLSRNINLSW